MIRITGLTIQQGVFQLNDLSLEVPHRAYAILMGRSGTGKTTLLESVCGLRTIQAGRIELKAGVVANVAKGKQTPPVWPPGDREIGYVPQDGALFPTMTVAKNIGFALRLRNWEEDRITQRVAELGDWLGITHLLARTPEGLSGGEAQRVALGRALAPSPSTLCLDEPLSALDERTRQEMYDLLKKVQEKADVTTLHITHNPSEAQHLADLVLTLQAGELQVGQVNPS
jgi:ABC-type sugar transport system ATPase subunit